MSVLLSGLRVQVPCQVTQCCSVLLVRGEKECACQIYVCVCRCVRIILRGESVPGVNVFLGLVRNFYMGVLTFPRVLGV